ncbi:MAG TPA: GNAT family N-acetyltransferase [Kofleriaceae bacterium]|nr:GNAT family N-acetyltransferase [Kofleriaceae bacterium]
MEIRPARVADGPRIVELIRLLASFENLPAPGDEDAGRLLAHAFEERRLELWVADDGGEVIAYAACFTTYSTFRARPTLFLEDLFVHPAARRRGVATALLARLRGEAEARGCGRFEWMVLDWNLEAQKLYSGIGATMLPEWRLVRIDLP